MKASWRKILRVLLSPAGGLLWAGGHPRRRAWLVPRSADGRELPGRIVRLSTIVDMEGEDLLEDASTRQSTDAYWVPTEKAKELLA